MRELVIRAASEVDASAIAELCQRTVRETNAADYTPEAIERIVAFFAAAEVLRRMADRKVFVACDGEMLAGTASLGPDKVHTVFVHTGLQQRGVGRRMMAFVEDVARGEGRRALALSSSITAVPFYARLGYVEAGREMHQSVAAVLMVKIL